MIIRTKRIIIELKYKDAKGINKSMKSITPFKSVIQTIYNIIKAHGGVPIAIGIKVETKKRYGVYNTITCELNALYQ